jgi:hypothetical protein
MSIKIDRRTQGPSWVEVILGAVLSGLLGIVLGAVLLVLRPAVVVKPGSKEATMKEADRDPKAVYFVEGSRDGSQGRQALAKRKSFVEGQSVTVNEAELNALAAIPAAAAAPKPGDASKPADKGAPGAAPTETLATGAPNFRIRDGALQVGVPVTVSVFGLSQKVLVQTRGGFVKTGEMFTYQPTDFYIGSCPLQRLPFVASYVRDKYLTSQLIPEDIKASWVKLANVAFDGNTLKLTMP